MTSHPEHDLLSVYADGDADAHERTAVEAHLASCADARTLLAAIRSTLQDLDAIGEPEMDSQVSFAIRSAVARERKLAGRGRRYGWAAGAAAAALIGVVGFVALRPDGATPDRTTGGAGAVALEALADQNYTKDSAGSLLQSLASEYSDARTAATTTEMNAEAPPQDSAASGAQFSGGSADETGYRDCLMTIERESKDANLRRSIAARFEGEPVYLLLFEVPAGKPTRLELWVLARADCEVRYFTQRSI